MSQKQRFAVRALVEIWDERKGSIWATAVNADRAQLIAEALNAAYDRPAKPKPQEFPPVVRRYYVVAVDDASTKTTNYCLNCETSLGTTGHVATFDNRVDAEKERDRLNAAQPSAVDPFRGCVGAYRVWESLPDDPFHVYGSHDLVNQTFCYKVRRKDAEGVEYLVATFDTVDAAIKERDRLNAEAKAAQQPTAADPVDAPSHYRQGEIECIDAVKAMLGAEGFAHWLRGNIVAYLWRMPHKGEAVKDAGKARNLAERLERLLGG